MELVRTALFPTGLPLYLWPECVKSVVHARNLTPNSTLHHHMRDKGEKESVKEAAQLLNNDRFVIGDGEDRRLAKHQWVLKSARKNDQKEMKFQVEQRVPQPEGQKISKGEQRRINAEGRAVAQKLQHLYYLIPAKKEPQGKNRINSELDKKIIP